MVLGLVSTGPDGSQRAVGGPFRTRRDAVRADPQLASIAMPLEVDLQRCRRGGDGAHPDPLANEVVEADNETPDRQVSFLWVTHRRESQ